MEEEKKIRPLICRPIKYVLFISGDVHTQIVRTILQTQTLADLQVCIVS